LQPLIKSKETVIIQQINCAPVDSDITIIRFINLKKTKVFTIVLNIDFNNETRKILLS
jgi:hypothetical protein